MAKDAISLLTEREGRGQAIIMLRLALLVEKKRNGGEKKKTFITHARRWMYQELEVAGVCAKLGHCDPTYGGRKGHCRISGNSAAAAISPPAGSRFLLVQYL